MINIRNIDALRAMTPFLVAHRGGIIAPDAPENSMPALERAAATQGYAMVELDVFEAADGVPVLMHDGLFINCGVDGRICNLSSDEITRICYRGSNEHVLTLAQAVEKCTEYGLGIMLDKLCRDDPAAPDMSARCLENIRSMLQDAGLASATVAIVDSPILREHLGDVTLFPMQRDTLREIAAGKDIPLEGQFCFAWAAQLPDETVKRLHENGARIIVSINEFHYPKHAVQRLAQEDIQRLLKAGVEGFQIDSILAGCVRYPEDRIMEADRK